MAGVVASDVVAKLTTSLLALFVEGAAVLRREAEARWSGCERAARVGAAYVKEWVVHGLISFLERQRRARYRCYDDISEAIVKQGRVWKERPPRRFATLGSGVAPTDEQGH